MLPCIRLEGPAPFENCAGEEAALNNIGMRLGSEHGVPVDAA